jgi:hypothetical protein
MVGINIALCFKNKVNLNSIKKAALEKQLQLLVI